jgi:hypothetical protein
MGTHVSATLAQCAVQHTRAKKSGGTPPASCRKNISHFLHPIPMRHA